MKHDDEIDALTALMRIGKLHPATTHGLAPRPTIPMVDGADSAGMLLQRMRAEERY